MYYCKIKKIFFIFCLFLNVSKYNVHDLYIYLSTDQKMVFSANLCLLFRHVITTYESDLFGYPHIVYVDVDHAC